VFGLFEPWFERLRIQGQLGGQCVHVAHAQF
jgi:hypothetical protein